MTRLAALSFVSIFILALVMGDPLKAQDAGGTDRWLGMNHGDVDQAMLIADLQKLGIHMVRDGFNSEPDAAFGAKVDAYVVAGIDAHISVNMRGAGIDVADYPTWLANYKQRCIDIMTAYKGKLDYYIVGNEPDKHDAFTGRLTPEQAVDFTRMAFEASRQVDPSGGIKIESPPISSPRPIRNYYRNMLKAGLANYCDYIGIHVYSNQINDGRTDDPWKGEQEIGGTQRPLAVSEMGTSTNWAPKSLTPEQKEQWKADFLDMAYVQLKRYGMANVILFDSSDSSKWPGTFDLLRDGSSARNVQSTTYNELEQYLKPRGLRDAGFEEANDFKHEWVVYHDPVEETWDTSAYNFQAPGGHTGQSALQIDTTNGKGSRIVRQVVSGLTVGQPVAISAWVLSSNDEGGALKAEGYNATAGNVDTTVTTKGKGAWEQLSVTVTPTNPWVVIELSAPTTKTAGSFVKFDDVGVTPADGR